MYSVGLVVFPTLVGIILGRAFRKIDDRSIAICLLYLFLPVYLLQTLGTPLDGGKELGLVFFFLFFHTAALWIVGAFALRIMGIPSQTHSLILLTILLSQPYLFPSQLARLFIGDLDGAAVESASRIFYIALLIFVTAGGYLGSPRRGVPERLFDMIRLPIAPLALVGFVLGLLQIRAGPALAPFLDPISQAAVPLTFLLVGILIGKEFYLFELPSLTPMLVAVGVAALVRLVFSPIVSVALIQLPIMPVDPSLGRLLILHTAMPTSALAAVFVAYHGQPREKRYVAVCVIATALLSCATLPFAFLWTGL